MIICIHMCVLSWFIHVGPMLSLCCWCMIIIDSIYGTWSRAKHSPPAISTGEATNFETAWEEKLPRTQMVMKSPPSFITILFHGISKMCQFPSYREGPVNLQFPKQTSRSGEVKAKTTGTSRCKRFSEYPDVQIQKKKDGWWYLVTIPVRISQNLPTSSQMVHLLIISWQLCEIPPV